MTTRKPDKRLEYAKELFDQGLSFAEIGRKLKIPDSTVRSWNFRYWNPPQPWPKETVLEAERLYKQGKRAVDIAYALGVPDSTVRRWASQKGWSRNSGLSVEDLKDKELERLERAMNRVNNNLERIRNAIEDLNTEK
jgi:uncharacterized protein YjcR